MIFEPYLSLPRLRQRPVPTNRVRWSPSLPSLIALFEIYFLNAEILPTFLAVNECDGKVDLSAAIGAMIDIYTFHFIRPLKMCQSDGLKGNHCIPKEFEGFMCAK